MNPLDQMRLSYDLAGLDILDVADDPMVQFNRWFSLARGSDAAAPPDWLEVNAMTLSTCDRSGNVSSRIVLLKEISHGAFVFFTNYESTKAQQMAANSHAALCFYWPHLQRQVRIQGTVDKIDRQRSAAYFHSRPRESQLGAHVSRQSSVIASRNELETRMKSLQSEYPVGTVIPLPDNWGGYALTPQEIEFWQGRASRLHDRILYRRQSSQWTLTRLAP